MKHFIIGLNFLFENSQAPPLENTIPPCGTGPPQKNKKVPAPATPFLRMLQNF